MPNGRIYQGNARAYGQLATAALLDNKPSTEGTSDCEVWKFDVEQYNKTKEVVKLEYLGVEKEQKLRCKQKGAHFIWVKEGEE